MICSSKVKKIFLVILILVSFQTFAERGKSFFDRKEQVSLQNLIKEILGLYPPNQYQYLTLSEEGAVFADIVEKVYPGTAAKIPISDVRELGLMSDLQLDWDLSKEDPDKLRDLSLRAFPAEKIPEFQADLSAGVANMNPGKTILVIGATVDGVKLMMATEKIRKLMPGAVVLGLALDRNSYFAGQKPYYEKIDLSLPRYRGIESALAKSSAVSGLRRWIEPSQTKPGYWTEGILSPYHLNLYRQWVDTFSRDSGLQDAAIRRRCRQSTAKLARLSTP